MKYQLFLQFGVRNNCKSVGNSATLGQTLAFSHKFSHQRIIKEQAVVERQEYNRVASIAMSVGLEGTDPLLFIASLCPGLLF